jgi:spore germination cell wall hydrolase CwlJ-like protein
MPSPTAQTPVQHWLPIALVSIALVAVGLPLAIVLDPPAIPAAPKRVVAPARVVPPAELPPVEPVRFQQLAPDDARAWNASVPFSTGPNPAARPFKLTGTPDDQARAIDCMAAAMLYEAGDDPVGQRAVGQVVINRARHPAFPKTICGVVFQGSERSTGCQFTFTCDGAITRAPNPAAWERARKIAEQALNGSVFAKVGYATHYHTDWVVPYWSASLDKIAEVHTHLFFRWTGWWGTPPAFRRAVSGAEPTVPQLSALSPAHGMGLALDGAAGATITAAALLATRTEAALSAGTFLVTLERKLTTDQLPTFAEATCGERDYCKLLGWRDKKDTPSTLPATPQQMGAMAFSYLRDKSKGFEKALWNCDVYKRANPRECMKVQFLFAPNPAPSEAIVAPAPRATLSLPAVTPAATPTPKPSPTPRPSASPTAAAK